jgi:8-oxo-dGTP pyrophosphatase MutT (NUDIX family)
MSKKSRLKKLAVRDGKLEQVAALPFRRGKGGVEILVVTSRRTKRLIIPKGWPMHGISNARAAQIEADEEAGVKGFIGILPLGTFDYVKVIGSKGITVTASVYPLEVEKVKSSWKERKQRKRKWLSVKNAAERLDDAGLRSLIESHGSALMSRDL